jgi:hypothetical protein
MAGWHFLLLPKTVSAKIDKDRQGIKRRGWGSIPVKVTIGKLAWETSIFPDKKSGTYLLPFKSEMRKKLGSEQGDILKLSLTMAL